MDDTHGEQSVTQWIDGAKVGNEESRHALWTRYYQRLVTSIRKRLHSGERRTADEEDLASVAFAEVFRALDEGRLERLDGRDGLWHLLMYIADQKLIDQRRYQHREKRGGGKVRGHSAFGIDADGAFNDVPDPNPEFVDQFDLTVGESLTVLREDLRQVAIWKLSGYTNKEIAVRLGCVEESVRRKVLLIRSNWES